MTDIREQELQQKITELTTENEWLKSQVEWLRKQVFGPKTEKRKPADADSQMLSLFNEAETEAQPSTREPALTVTIKEHTRKKKKAGHRKELLENVPHQKVVIDLDDKDKICQNCGSELSAVGETYIRSEVTYIPARLEVIDYYQKAYECRNCRQNGQPRITKAVMPQPVIAHSYASPSAVAHIMTQKYEYALPLYRQEKEWQQLNVPLLRAHLANWIVLAAKEWLQPMVRRFHEQLLTEPCLHADETPVQVHHEPGRKNTSTSYMWVYTTGPFSEGPAIRIFEYQPSRNGDHAVAFLNGFHGYLHSDDFAGYHKLKQVKHCLCWAHARRKFVEAKPSDTNTLTGTLIQEGLDRINALFAKEKEAASLSAEDRKQWRQKEEKPLLDDLWKWAETNVSNVLPKSPISKALNYVLSNKKDLETYLEDGHCSISNNAAENSIRPFVVGRKNWLFSNSPKGAAASACVYSVIETCKANGINAEHYLIYVFQHLPNEDIQRHPERLEAYLPWNEKIKENCSK